MCARSAARRRTSASVERGSAAWRSTHRRSASATTGSHGSPVVKPAPGPAVGRRLPRDRRALGIAPVDVDDAVGRDLRVGQAELLALVDERRAAQGVQQHRDRARPRRTLTAVVEPARHAREVVVGEEPRRPRRSLRQRLEVIDRRLERVGVPGHLDELEVVREMQLVTRLQVADGPVQVLQRDLADDHPVGVLVHHPADAAQPLVDRVPVLVVAARRADVVAQQRVLGDLGDRVEPEPVDVALEPEAQHVVHRMPRPRGCPS